VVNQALEYSRSECGAIVLQEIPFNLKSVITGCFDVYKEKARQKGLSLTYGVSENIPAELIGDPGRLCQIIGNLVDNSIKFTQQGGIDLHVSLEHEDEKDLVLHFDVVDTGIGIPPEYIGRLFERFSQVNTPGPCKCKGSGLGLSICKNLVEIMGGRIFAESAPDKGSRFSFLIKFRK
jgi:signal transduction histidine kinase